MFKFIFLIIVFITIFYLITNHVKIKIKTFFQRGYFKTGTPYGIYVYHNKQGSGKTQSAVSFLLENKDKRIYANLKSLKGINYKYFSGWNTLLNLGINESDCIIFYDELFKGLFKGKKMREEDKKNLMDFMSQMRKRNIIFITTAQEWLEIPIEFRRYVRYDIECSIKSIFGYPIIIKKFYNTELIKWDNLENEYVSPIIETIIEHGRKKIVNSYDTFEQISNDELLPIDMYNNYFESEYVIKSNEDVSPPLSEEENIISDDNDLSNYYTTTNSNSIVNSQLTNILQSDTISTQEQETHIDKGFWTDLDNDDFN